MKSQLDYRFFKTQNQFQLLDVYAIIGRRKLALEMICDGRIYGCGRLINC